MFKTVMTIFISICGAWLFDDYIIKDKGFLAKHCPATQPGLIVRDLDHPPSVRPADREWVVMFGNGAGIVQVGLNEVQAEGVAYQLNQMFGKNLFRAQKAVTVTQEKE